MHHLKERADMVAKRRSGDDEDDLALAVGAPLPIDQGVDGLNADSGPSSAVRRIRRSERESRRARRKLRQAKLVGTDEGYSTDSSLAEGDALDYAAATRDLGKRVNGLLEDVRAEDFRDPEKGVAVKFGDWRKRYEEEYVSAFGGLAMVQAWEFYARSEMVGWEPLRVSRARQANADNSRLLRSSRSRGSTRCTPTRIPGQSSRSRMTRWKWTNSPSARMAIWWWR